MISLSTFKFHIHLETCVHLYFDDKDWNAHVRSHWHTPCAHVPMLASNNQHPERLKLFCKHTYFDDKDSNTQMHAHWHAHTMIVWDIFHTAYQLLFCLNGSERKTRKKKGIQKNQKEKGQCKEREYVSCVFSRWDRSRNLLEQLEQ